MYHSKFENEAIGKLFAGILELESEEDCYRFFEDLCTVNELQSLAQRFEVALLLDEGRTYHEIAEKTGASTATISRINRCLVYGSEGYKTVIKRLKRQ